MIRAAISGRLGADPVERATRNGKPMSTASIAVDCGRPGEEATEWVSVVAFGSTAEALSTHLKGDIGDAMGDMRRSTYTGRDGVERTSWSLVAEQVLSARVVKAARSPRRRSRPRLALVGAARPTLDDPVDDLWRDGGER
jgi:single-strand DNA-binding protein